MKILSWFEIPVSDLDRAMRFYETVFGFTMLSKPELQMSWFMGENNEKPLGALIKHEQFYKADEQKGVLIYFQSPSGDLANELTKVEDAGGKVLITKRAISQEFGFMGIFVDSEGNRIGLRSKK